MVLGMRRGWGSRALSRVESLRSEKDRVGNPIGLFRHLILVLFMCCWLVTLDGSRRCQTVLESAMENSLVQ